MLSRARNVALTALQQYDIEWTGIKFIQLSDTITFKIETNSESYLLRIHSDRLNKEEIHSEIIFLNEIRSVHGLIVPVGVASRNEGYVLECETEEGYQKPYVTLMKWVEGEKLMEKLSDTRVYNKGVLMGRLHKASTNFKEPANFVRPHWGIDSFRQDVCKLERYYPRFLSRKAWGQYQSAIAKINHQLETMPRSDLTYGVIHADLHSGNVVFNNDYPYPIDFGRSGYGYFLYDIAGALLELPPKHRKLFIQGYESIMSMDEHYVRKLECFFIMFMIENYCHHSSNPKEIPNLINEQKIAQAYIQEYLHGNQFIFKMIKPVEIEKV